MQGYSKDLLDTIRQSLEEEKKIIAARIDALTAQDSFSDTARTSDNAASDAEASEEENHDRYAAQVAELTRQVAAVDQALLRVSDGTYGFCQVCGTMIDTDRLSIIPTANLCLEHEKKKKS